MKKFLIVLGCVIGFALICVIAYFAPGAPDDIEIPTGKYYLTKVIEEKDGEEATENIDINISTDFLEVYEGKKLKSFSTRGFFQDGKTYTYTLVGTAFKLYLDGEKAFEQMYAEETILIYYEQIENDEIILRGNYFFTLKK